MGIEPAERGLLDTSVVIAVSKGVSLELPAQGAISVVTLCGLHHGALVSSGAQQGQRIAVLAAAERDFEVLPVDARVAPHFGRLMAEARSRGRRPRVSDALIAATAISHALPLFSRDRDFERMEIPALQIV